jgi:hypothetical protein
MTSTYVLVWRRDGSPGIVWYLRALNPDGFYGEIRRQPPDPRFTGRATGVQNRFTDADRERVADILAELSAAGPTDPGPCFALLGRYTETLGQSEIVFKYDPGAEASCPRARRFLELHTIIETYLAEAYAQITEQGAKA